MDILDQKYNISNKEMDFFILNAMSFPLFLAEFDSSFISQIFDIF